MRNTKFYRTNNCSMTKCPERRRSFIEITKEFYWKSCCETLNWLWNYNKTLEGLTIWTMKIKPNVLHGVRGSLCNTYTTHTYMHHMYAPYIHICTTDTYMNHIHHQQLNKCTMCGYMHNMPIHTPYAHTCTTHTYMHHMYHQQVKNLIQTWLAFPLYSMKDQDKVSDLCVNQLFFKDFIWLSVKTAVALWPWVFKCQSQLLKCTNLNHLRLSSIPCGVYWISSSHWCSFRTRDWRGPIDQ